MYLIKTLLFGLFEIYMDAVRTESVAKNGRVIEDLAIYAFKQPQNFGFFSIPAIQQENRISD